MQKLTDFLADFQGEEDYDDLELIFATMPSDAIVVVDEITSDPNEPLVFAALQEVPCGPDITYNTKRGFTVASSPDSKVFRLTWPTDIVSSPCIYILTDSYAAP